MKSIILLNNKYFRHYKAKVIKQIFVFLLCSMLLVIQGLSAYSLHTTIDEKQKVANGDYDAILINLNDNKSSLPVVDSGEFALIGTMTNQQALYNNTLNIGFANKNAAALSCLKYSKGKPPQNANEIAIEKSVFSVLRKNLNIGDTLTIEINCVDGENIVKQDFVICGIIENYSKTQWKIKDSDSLLPQIFISEQFFNKFSYPYIQLNVINFSDEISESDIEDILSKNEICEGYFFNKQSSTDIELNQFVSVGTTVLVLFSGAVAVFLMINNLMLKREETQKKIGLYRILGMNKLEIISTLLLRELPWLLLGGIVGSFCGFILLKNIYPIVMHTNYSYKVEIFIFANIFLVAFYLFILFIDIVRFSNKTVIEDIKPNATTNESDIKDIDIQNPVFLWAWKNYKLNKKASTSLSLLVLVAILFNVIGNVGIDYVNTQIEMSSPADIEIVAYDGAANGPLSIPADIKYGIQNEDLSYLLESQNIENYICLKNLIINVEVPLKTANSIESGLWHSNEYKDALQKYGYNENIGLRQDFLVGTNKNAIKLLESQKNLQGKINYDKLSSGQEVILCNAGGLYNDFNVGDKITLTQIIDNNKYEFTVTVGAIVNFETENYFESVEALAFGDRMIWDEKSFDVLGIELNVNHVLLSLKDTDAYEDIDTRLNALNNTYSELRDNKQFTISENFQQAEQYRTIKKILNIGYIFMIIIIVLFVFTSSFISTKIRFEQQKKVFASIRAIGLTKNNIFLMLFIEKLCQIVLSCILGTILSVVFIFLFNREIGVNLIGFPYLSYFVLMIVLLLSSLIISYVSAFSFCKNTIAEQLHHD